MEITDEAQYVRENSTGHAAAAYLHAPHTDEDFAAAIARPPRDARSATARAEYIIDIGTLDEPIVDDGEYSESDGD
jgi:hypothetical protein